MVMEVALVIMPEVVEVYQAMEPVVLMGLILAVYLLQTVV
jgi:hypothetical protein